MSDDLDDDVEEIGAHLPAATATGEEDEPSVVGRIVPDPVDSPGDPSSYAVVDKRIDWTAEASAARPCAHRKFILDEKWKTVTCKTCGEKLDPYAVLLHYVDHWQELERRRDNLEHAERDLLASSLRRYADLATTTDEEQMRIKRLLTFGLPYGREARAEHLAELRKFSDELRVLTAARRRHRKDAARPRRNA